MRHCRGLRASLPAYIAGVAESGNVGEREPCGGRERSYSESSWPSLPASAHAAREHSTTDRLKDRRAVAAGARAYSIGFQDGRFYANGWHITGEMGGIWSPPMKLADGIWFGIDDEWVKPATRFTSARGHVRYAFPPTAGLRLARTDFVPDDRRAALYGLTLANPAQTAKTVTVKVDVHSELMGAYPWTGSAGHPTAADNLIDIPAYQDGRLVFTDRARCPARKPHDYAALVGSTRAPEAGETGAGFRGPQPGTVCAAPTARSPPSACDDGPHGKGVGGQLRYRVTIGARGVETVWIAVAGSNRGLDDARNELNTALQDPDAQLTAKLEARDELAARSVVDLPGDRRLQEAVDWGKQNLADLTQTATDLKVRFVDQGKAYPEEPEGTIRRATFFGAGYPDYPWLFATDGEYTAFPAVALGQFETAEAHLRAIRCVSDLLNDRSGKVAHEIVTDGSVYFGADKDPGNTDESVKFPSAVALVWRWTGDNTFRDNMYDFSKRTMRYVTDELDADNDGWPEGLGNVERDGHGRGEARQRRLLRPRPLRPRRHGPLQARPHDRALGDRHRRPRPPRASTATWWDGDPVRGLAARRRARPAAALDRRHADGGGADDRRPRLPRPRARRARDGRARGARERLLQRRRPAQPRPLPHRLPGRRRRQGRAQGVLAHDRRSRPSARATTAASRSATRPPTPTRCSSPTRCRARCRRSSPRPDQNANIDRCWTCRSMFMQAWGHYGTAWPVIHQQLGVRPSLGTGRLEIVPSIPEGQTRIGGRDIRLGDDGSVDVRAQRSGSRYTTTVTVDDVDELDDLRVGATLPAGEEVDTVTLDGDRVRRPTVRETNRGVEVTVTAPSNRAHTCGGDRGVEAGTDTPPQAGDPGGMSMRWKTAATLGAAMLFVPATASAAPELSASDRLQDRREVTAGTRAYSVGFQDGRFYANGWHITGEMGGIWAPPLKLADGVWFGVDDQWVGQATKFTSGRGYTRYDLPPAAGLELRRIDVVPTAAARRSTGSSSPIPARRAKTVTVKVDVHSELLGAYPWGFDDVVPNAQGQPRRHGGVRGRRARLHRQGHAARRRAARLRDARRLRPPAERRRDRPGPLGTAARHALRGERPGRPERLRRRPVRQRRRRPAALPRDRQAA